MAFRGKGVGVVCHRGANKVAPENTRAAAEQAIVRGARFVEVDVRTSKDGVLYNLHDPTVDRTTNGSGRLRDLTAEAIDKLDAGGWFAPTFAGEPLPRLKPLLRGIQDRAGVFFDVKDADSAQLIALVREIELQENCFFWFGDDAQAQEFHALAPDLPLKINASTVAEIERAIAVYGARIVEMGVEALTPEVREFCRARDVAIMPIVMENDPEAFRRVIEARADLINLDYPDAFRTVEKAFAESVGGATP